MHLHGFVYLAAKIRRICHFHRTFHRILPHSCSLDTCTGQFISQYWCAVFSSPPSCPWISKMLIILWPVNCTYQVPIGQGCHRTCLSKVQFLQKGSLLSFVLGFQDNVMRPSFLYNNNLYISITSSLWDFIFLNQACHWNLVLAKSLMKNSHYNSATYYKIDQWDFFLF